VAIADVEPALHGLLAPPIYAAGVYTDAAHFPEVELRDAVTNDPIPDVTVTVASMQPEDSRAVDPSRSASRARAR
jgi:hypothetical protein